MLRPSRPLAQRPQRTLPLLSVPTPAASLPAAPLTASGTSVTTEHTHTHTRAGAVFGSGYLRPRSGEAHGQQHVQTGATFHRAPSVLSEPPREDFTVEVLFGSHAHPCPVRARYSPSAAPALVHERRLGSVREERLAATTRSRAEPRTALRGRAESCYSAHRRNRRIRSAR